MKSVNTRLPRPKRQTRHIALRVPIDLFTSILEVRHPEETISETARRLIRTGIQMVRETQRAEKTPENATENRGAP